MEQTEQPQQQEQEFAAADRYSSRKPEERKRPYRSSSQRGVALEHRTSAKGVEGREYPTGAVANSRENL